MEIAISTCNRQPAYIHGTLESMFAADERFASDNGHGAIPVRLVVCDSDAGYLEPWLRYPGIRVEALSEREHSAMRELAAGFKTTRNFMRILEGGGDLLALQDDLELAERWLMRLESCVERIERRHGQLFVLALYASYKFQGTPFAPYKPWHFYGNQALYIPASVRWRLAGYMREHAEKGTLTVDDMMVKDFLTINQDLKLFAMNPNIVQHVGEESAIEQRFHQSPSYKQRGYRD